MKILKRTLITLCALIIFALLALFINERINDKVFLTKYTYRHSEIPKAFEGYKIMAISDLHEAPFSGQILEHIDNESRILSFLREIWCSFRTIQSKKPLK